MQCSNPLRSLLLLDKFASSSTDLDSSLVFGLCVPEDSQERGPPRENNSITDHYVKYQEWSRAHGEKWNILELGTPVLVVPKLFRGDKKRSVANFTPKSGMNCGWWTKSSWPIWDVYGFKMTGTAELHIVCTSTGVGWIWVHQPGKKDATFRTLPWEHTSQLLDKDDIQEH